MAPKSHIDDGFSLTTEANNPQAFHHQAGATLILTRLSLGNFVCHGWQVRRHNIQPTHRTRTANDN